MLFFNQSSSELGLHTYQTLMDKTNTCLSEHCLGVRFPCERAENSVTRTSHFENTSLDKILHTPLEMTWFVKKRKFYSIRVSRAEQLINTRLLALYKLNNCFKGTYCKGGLGNCLCGYVCNIVWINSVWWKWVHLGPRKTQKFIVDICICIATISIRLELEDE